jgi:N-acetylglutamate synthase-like GNAT family acetyltransferase
MTMICARATGFLLSSSSQSFFRKSTFQEKSVATKKMSEKRSRNYSKFISQILFKEISFY